MNGGSGRPEQGAGRFEQWQAGWRVALRMARRDVRRHRGRSILILLMIGLPVLLISAGATLAFSMTLDDSEQEPYLFGTGQAIVSGPVEGKQIYQEALGGGWGSDEKAPPANPIVGIETDPARAIAGLTGGTAIPLSQGPLRVESAEKTVSVNALGVSLQPHADLGDRAHLISGRWPANDAEVVVTKWGAGQGLPTSGRLSIATADSKDAVFTSRTVVGVAEAVTGTPMGMGVAPAAVVLVPWQQKATGPGPDAPAWLIIDRGPVSWEEVQDLNSYGLVTVARSLWALPPQALPVNDHFGASPDTAAAGTAIAMAAAAAGLLFTTALLAGPAFAVSASRQRRTLALSAANGATRTQVRRTILAQAVVLGGISTIVGTAVGVGAVAALRPWLARVLDERLLFGLDVPWVFLAAVAGSALLSAVVAALLPARALGRLDIVRAMRGQEVARPVRHRVTIVGLVLLAIGAVLTLTQVDVSDGMQQAGFGLIGGSALLTIGALCVVPGLLTVIGRLGRHLPLSIRMAARDSARQRARTGPTVAAVMAGAALLSASVVAISSDTAEQAHTYVPNVAMGTATTYDSLLGAEEVARIVASVDPGIVTVRAATLARAVQDDSGFQPQPWATGPGRLVQAQRVGCTFEQSRPTESFFPEQRCWSIGTDGMMGAGAIRTAPAVQLATLLQLDEAQRTALADGAVVLPDVSTIPTPARPGTFDAVRPTPTDVQGGAVRFWVMDGESAENGDFKPAGAPQTVTRPALVLPWDQFSLGQSQVIGGYSAYLATEAADRLGWANQPGFVQLVDPDGPISAATEAKLTSALQAASENASVQVERGFQRDDSVAILVLMGIVGLIILVATFVSTALSMAEQLPMMGTLAAVGATRMTRRKLAAAQAFLLSGLGAVVGAAIGLLPGIAAAKTVTTTGGQSHAGFVDMSAVPEVVGPFVVIPWLQIAAPIVLVPIVAAVFAFVSIRRAPTVTRRAT
ncbi:MAG: FtsX-like permease family protein [Intrasporangium sp.]|uniref:FtsX-like permease family protein n=1 Tax=Intrasporangium sp. TaxID=1925024 RepID=UPI003F81097E